MLSKLVLLAAPASTLLGALAFVAVTVYLAFERCASGCTGFFEGMSKTPSLEPSALIAIGLVIGMAVIGRRGREFAVGFFGACLAAAVLTQGEMLFLWGIPSLRAVAAGMAEAPVKSRIERVTALQARGLDERAGGELIYRVLDCVKDPAPRLPEEVASGACSSLMSSWEGTQNPDPFTDGDDGWRWGYRKSRTGFRVWVQPDVLLERVDQQFDADETRRVTVQRRVGEPRAEYADPR